MKPKPLLTLISIASMAFWMASGPALAHSDAAQPDFSKAQIFDYGHSADQQLHLVSASPRAESRETSAKQSSDYRFPEFERVQGKLWQYVLDFPEAETHLSLHDQVMQHLLKHGFTAKFHCLAADCGPGGAWAGLFNASLETEHPWQSAGLHYRDNSPEAGPLWIQWFQTRIGCCQRLWWRVVQEPLASQTSDLNFLSAFSPDSAELDSDAKLRLEALAGILQSYPDKRVALIAGTDATGTEHRNRQLRLERKQAVKEALIAQGIQGHRLIVRETDPIQADEALHNSRFAGYYWLDSAP